VLTMPVRNASFLSEIISEKEGKLTGEAEADGPNMAEADGASMSTRPCAEADSANMAAVKRGANNISEANKIGGESWEVDNDTHAS
jgi:hypothetical protein